MSSECKSPSSLPFFFSFPSAWLRPRQGGLPVGGPRRGGWRRWYGCFLSSGMHAGPFVAGRLAATAASDPQGPCIGISFHIPAPSCSQTPLAPTVLLGDLTSPSLWSQRVAGAPGRWVGSSCIISFLLPHLCAFLSFRVFWPLPRPAGHFWKGQWLTLWALLWYTLLCLSSEDAWRPLLWLPGLSRAGLAGRLREVRRSTPCTPRATQGRVPARLEACWCPETP